VLGGGICECLWLGDNDVTLSMVKRAYQNFNNTREFMIWHHATNHPYGSRVMENSDKIREFLGSIYLSLGLG
jgi:hypothetical protein